MLAVDGIKCCTKCEESKPVSEFGKNAKTLDGLFHWCKPCSRAQTAQWRAANLERNRENSRAWRAANPGAQADACRRSRLKHGDKRRAEVSAWFREHPELAALYENRRRARSEGASGSHTVEEFRDLLQHYGGKCAYCGAPATCRDHVIPLKRGGSDNITNLLPACASCNSSKRTRQIWEWRPELMWRGDITARLNGQPSIRLSA